MGLILNNLFGCGISGNLSSDEEYLPTVVEVQVDISLGCQFGGDQKISRPADQGLINFAVEMIPAVSPHLGSQPEPIIQGGHGHHQKECKECWVNSDLH